MSRLARATSLLPVLALVLVAADTEDPQVLEPCDNAEELEVLTLDGLQTTIATPGAPGWGIGVPGSSEQKDLILDLAGQPLDQTGAFVTVVMSWDVPVEDYDLNLNDDEGSEVDHSENIQPIDGDTEEVSGGFRHCDVFQVESLNWTAAGVSTLTLDISAA